MCSKYIFKKNIPYVKKQAKNSDFIKILCTLLLCVAIFRASVVEDSSDCDKSSIHESEVLLRSILFIFC